MRNLKKFVFFFLCISVICILSACSKDSKSDANSSDASSTSDDKSKVDDANSTEKSKDTNSSKKADDNSTKKETNGSNNKNTSNNKQSQKNSNNKTTNTRQSIAMHSLLNKEWKPSSAEKFDDKTKLIDTVNMREIYGSNWKSGGIKFFEDGNFQQDIGVYAQISKGTYTVDDENITLKYTSGDYKGTTYVCGYDYANDGKVMYFIIKDEDENLIRFDPK